LRYHSKRTGAVAVFVAAGLFIWRRQSETVLLSDAMAHLAPEVLSKNFGVDEKAFENVPKQELFIFQTDVPGG
jgi:hypothetical protein